MLTLFSSLRKNLMIMVALAVLPALAIILYSGLDQRREAIASAKREIRLLVQSLSEAQQGQLEAVRQTLATLAQIPEIRDFDAVAGSAIMQAVLEQTPVVFNIAAAHIDGNVFASARPFAVTNLADRMHFRAALAGKDLAAGEYLLTRIGGNEPVFAYAYPVLDPSGAPRAVLTLALRLAHLSHLFDVVPLPEGSFLAITDHQGIRLSYYPAKEATNPVGQPIAPSAWTLAEGGQDRGLGTVESSDGVRRIVAFQAVRLGPDQPPHMYLWAGIPEGQVLAAADRILFTNLLLLFASILAAMLFSWGIGKKTIVSPINSLVAATGRFAQGAFQVRSDLSERPGELGDLAQAFNRMAESLEKSQKSLRQSETKYRTLFESNADGLLIADMQTRRFQYANPMICRMLGYSAAELLELGVEDIHPAADLPRIREAFAKIPDDKVSYSVDIPCRRKDGSIFFADIHATILELEGVPSCLGMFRDISERKRNEDQLKYLATHDELTGLANRTLLQDRLEQALHYAHRSGRRLGLLLLDLDRFKFINDSLGHAFGDKLLCLLAQRLLQVVRETDTVARLGGDEFVILLGDVATAEDVGLVAAKILQHVAEPLAIDNREILLTASLGISLYPQDGLDGATLIRNADLAMYRAKKDGRSSFSFYAAELNLRAQETMELEIALRQALDRDEFCLHYQPKVELAGGRVVGCEALLRWCHPQRGLVSPADFIPLAEETGLIVSLGAWVLREACRQARLWQEQGLTDLTVAVNLSARQFRQGDLTQLVAEVLRDTGLEPRALDLELTESMVMDDPAKAEQTLLELKTLGVGLSLDDFGTGYSSLNYLRRFPVDRLKIDQSFIHDVVDDESGASVVTSVISIAHNLGMTAVAEGVETAEQLAFLGACGCDLYQGFLFSKPLPPEEFIQRLQNEQRSTS